MEASGGGSELGRKLRGPFGREVVPGHIEVLEACSREGAGHSTPRRVGQIVGGDIERTKALHFRERAEASNPLIAQIGVLQVQVAEARKGRGARERLGTPDANLVVREIQSNEPGDATALRQP